MWGRGMKGPAPATFVFISLHKCVSAHPARRVFLQLLLFWNKRAAICTELRPVCRSRQTQHIRTIWTKADWRSHDTCKYTPCVVLCKADHRGRLWHVRDITPNRCFTHYNNVWFLLCPTHPHTEWGNNSEEEAELEQHFLCWLCTL